MDTKDIATKMHKIRKLVLWFLRLFAAIFFLTYLIFGDTLYRADRHGREADDSQRVWIRRQANEDSNSAGALSRGGYDSYSR
jgi:hypothetical protein